MYPQHYLPPDATHTSGFVKRQRELLRDPAAEACHPLYSQWYTASQRTQPW
jgi:hypothetical protein